GGSSNATTHLLDEIHYLGLLRVARREKGIRLYAPKQHDQAPLNEVERSARIDALVDVVVRTYAPLTSSGLNYYIRRLRYAAPQWSDELTGALQRARQRLATANLDGVEWYWSSKENPKRQMTPDHVRLLAPFDPVVHDRSRFEILWGWEYRFEAYTPEPKRKFGYYALPVLWRDQVIGWANLAVKDGLLESRIGYVTMPRERIYRRELDAELERIRNFLGVQSAIK
ncbi:MAG TPA: crosslink repair DNA glycosylase YcaQ family protein, partial [Pyrinomonadaceae bacterium]|nr:crosslink repair DNA glycosylase YcaQ family protein [Pyrinomonadaceae bacterium]